MKKSGAPTPLVCTVGLTAILLLMLNYFVISTLVAHAASYTVCPAGPPQCNFKTIQAAVDAAHNGDTIKVAAGTYTDVHARPRRDILSTGSVTQVVYINRSIAIQGGYTSTNFTEEPNPAINVTTLDAQQKGRVFYITGAANVTIETLVIINGNAADLRGDPFFDTAGGGLYAISATITLRNNRIFSNTALMSGGGLFIYCSDSQLIGNMISNNDLTFVSPSGFPVGAGLFVLDGKATLISNTISDNGGYYASAFLIDSSEAMLINNTVSRNQNGGVLAYTNQGAIVMQNRFTDNNGPCGLAIGGSNAEVIGNTFLNNHLSGVCLSANDNSRLEQNIIEGNSGDGLYVSQSSPVLANNTITGNAGYEGGGLYLWLSKPTLINNLIADNKTQTSGSGLYLRDSSAQLLHTTIVSNTGGDGSSIYLTGTSSIALTNTILVSESVGISVNASSLATVNGILWFNNGVNADGAGFITITNAFPGDPLFGIDGYHILSGSAAIDAGVDGGVTTDIDLQPRPYQSPDLGADEYWPPGTLKYFYLPLILENN